MPRRFNFTGDQVDLDTYFMVARGNTADLNNNQCAGEMTKWFDTNYHYIVPEFNEETSFKYGNKILMNLSRQRNWEFKLDQYWLDR